MPDDTGQNDRLHRKIDRIVAGQPSPVLNDDDDEELAQLAQRLRDGMSEDMPDPGFREELKKDLIDPGPRLVRFRARPSRRAYPAAMFAGALAAVVIVTVTVGAMTYRSEIGRNGPSDVGAALADATPTVGGTAVLAAANSTERGAKSAAATRSAPAIAAGSGDTVVSVPTSTPAPQTMTSGSTAQPRSQLASISLPPLDDNHVELGALATVTARKEPVPDDVEVTLATELPDLPSSAPTYHLSAPHVDPDVLLRGIAQTLEIEASVSEETVQGRSVYRLTSESGVVFSWTPASGAFTCDLPESITVQEQEDIADAALQWLDNLGYPVDKSASAPVVESAAASNEWTVKIPVGDIPDPALGHPLNVSMLVNQEGRVIRATGYWLKLNRFREMDLMSAETAWQAILDGRGYWPAGTIPDTPGEFRVESFSISYILTLSKSNEVVLQPVVSASGTFYDSEGTPVGETSVFVQAAQLATT